MRWLRGGRDNDLQLQPEDGAQVEELSRKAMPLRWGRYTLLKHLGTGSLGETFVAREACPGDPPSQPASPEELAKELLIVRRGLVRISTSPFLQLFLSELNLYQQLVHPQICRLVYAGDQEGIPIIVSEYAMGKRLLHLLGRSRVSKEPLPWQIAVYITHELCGILEHLHGKTDGEGNNWNMVVFRGGFSIADIFIDHMGEVRIADVGIGPITLKQTTPMLPEGASVLDHKPFYLSPEAVRGEPPSQSSDLFCLGWLLWELATAGWLFAGANDFEKLTRIRDADVQPPRELNPALLVQVEEIVLKALARDPADRHASAEELRTQLAATTDMVSAQAELAALMQSVFADDLGKTRDELLRWTRC